MTYSFIDTPPPICQDDGAVTTVVIETQPLVQSRPLRDYIRMAVDNIRREFDCRGRMHIVTTVDCPDCGRQEADLGACRGCGGRSVLPAGAPNAWVRKQYRSRLVAEAEAALERLTAE